MLVGAGVATALLGAVMCFLQYHLKRMLAFATVSYVGLFLSGIGLLTADGLAGTTVYVIGDGLVKASLFVSVGILQHRRVRLDEAHLRGAGRDLPYTGAIFALGGLALAGLPPFGSFLGKAILEEAAHKEGYTWMPVLFTLTSILVGGCSSARQGRPKPTQPPKALTERPSQRSRRCASTLRQRSLYPRSGC